MSANSALWLPFITHLQAVKGYEWAGLMPLTEERSHFRSSPSQNTEGEVFAPTPPSVPLEALDFKQGLLYQKVGRHVYRYSKEVAHCHTLHLQIAPMGGQMCPGQLGHPLSLLLKQTCHNSCGFIIATHFTP